MPSERKNSITWSRWCSFPHPEVTKTRPSVTRATSGGSHASAAAMRSTSACSERMRSGTVVLRTGGRGERGPPLPRASLLLLLGGLGLGGGALLGRHHDEALPGAAVLALAAVRRGLALAVALARVHALALDLALGALVVGVGGAGHAGEQEGGGRGRHD